MKKTTFTNYFYLLPALVFVGLFLIYPAIRTVYISFTDWNGLIKPSFVGLSNYYVFRDPILFIPLLILEYGYFLHYFYRLVLDY